MMMQMDGGMMDDMMGLGWIGTIVGHSSNSFSSYADH